MRTNSYGQGKAIGNREYLDSTLTILEPEDTPFISSVSKSNDAIGTFHEAFADSLRPARTSGTKEGDEGAKGGNRAKNRIRFGSYLHRFHDTFSVTDVQQAIARKGGNVVTNNEYGDAKAKTLRELKRDMEAVCLGSQETKAGGEDDMVSRGAFAWCASSTTPAIDASHLTPAAQRLTGQANIVETGANSINSVLKSLAAKGGSRRYKFFCGNDYAEDVDLFTRTNNPGGSTETRYRVTENGTAHTITLMVKIFETSFGRVEVMPDQFCRIDASGVGSADSGLIADMDLWKFVTLEDLHAVDDWENAGGMGGYVKCIGGLFCGSPKGNATIINS